MKFTKLALALSAAILPFGLAAYGAYEAADVDSISYEDALQCTALMAVFMVTFEDGEDAETTAMFDDLLTRWSMVATTRGIMAGKQADKDIGAVTKAFGMELEALGDDDAATDKLFEERGDKCMDLKDANSDEFDAIDVDAINEADEDGGAA